MCWTTDAIFKRQEFDPISIAANVGIQPSLPIQNPLSPYMHPSGPNEHLSTGRLSGFRLTNPLS
ncbi:hypothetical protein GRAN_0768 [Granulicella sibirica]|uniref:Uncharacterized protein n=1 Tax=Granulicella sibirica TaxID=2479048 RepID=A0A4Q0T5T8_9BACT|nr:hypothetical protein GRAN_0768 [Granulicella sibirica]